MALLLFQLPWKGKQKSAPYSQSDCWAGAVQRSGTGKRVCKGGTSSAPETNVGFFWALTMARGTRVENAVAKGHQPHCFSSGPLK